MLHGFVTLGLALLLGPQAEPPSDRLYGRVLTAEGDRLEGYLRWDRNEASWTDLLDGQKEIPWETLREVEALDEEFRRRRERERSISLSGLRISWEEDDGEPNTTSAAVRFGHVRSIEVVDARRALLTLLSGEHVELRGGSTDVGRSFRGLVVEDVRRGEVTLRWRDLERVDLVQAPVGAPPPAASRLFGTLRTRGGAELVGYVAWDMDETLTSDVLDGEERGRDLEIDFASVAAIEREGREASRVTLVSGEELILRGTNDVDSHNRGIEVSDPRLGRAVVPWEEFESLTFRAPLEAAGVTGGGREAFDGGRPLRGTVETRAGRRHTGRVRWDNDEEWTWEVIDGRADGIEYDVELGQVRSIARVGSSAARVQLLDGRSLLLEGSSDVGEDNGGIIVRSDDGGTVYVAWRDFERVTFAP